MSAKPTVLYNRAIFGPVVNLRAIVVLAGPHHTITKQDLDDNDQVVTTSAVVALDPDKRGRFETLNTIYDPV